MIFCHREPTLKEALSDPLIHAVMAADGVDATELEALLTSVARKLARDPARRRAMAVARSGCGHP
jgi:hypothetical protein